MPHVMGGIYGGVFTPTEAGAVVALVAYRHDTGDGVTWGKLFASLMEAARVSGLMIFIIIGGVLFSKFLSTSGVSYVLVDWIVGLGLPPLFVLIAFLFMYLILSCFLTLPPVPF
jgi:C4-dicarboxylate transporter, DctM subunit